MAKLDLKRVRSFLHYNAWVLILDILAVNLAYFGALLLRFYIAFRFRDSLGYYMVYFFRFTPYYTVVSIVVFYLFRLYGGMWRYAGLNDMNRIIAASVITAAIHVVGTLLFVARMPISYYLIGAFIQFFFLCVIRFGYRFIGMEKEKIAKTKQGTIPALVVGSGDYGRRIVHHLEDNTPYRAVVIVGPDSGRSMDGIPVVSLDMLEDQVNAKKIQAIIIADESLTNAQRAIVKKAARDLEVRDFTGYLSNLSGTMPVSSILEYTEGPVTLVLNGQKRKYQSAQEAMEALTHRYEVKSISTPQIELEETHTDESWIQEYKDETGEDVSFF